MGVVGAIGTGIGIGLKFQKSAADIAAETAFDDHYEVIDPRASQD